MRVPKDSTTVEQTTSDGGYQVVAKQITVSTSRVVGLHDLAPHRIEALIEALRTMLATDADISGVDLAEEPETEVRVEVHARAYVRPEVYHEWDEETRQQWRTRIHPEGEAIQFWFPERREDEAQEDEDPS